MDGRCDFSGANGRSNLLREHAGNDQTHDLTLARGQLGIVLLQVRDLTLLLPGFDIALQSLLDRIEEVLIPEGLCQKFHCARLHRFDSHGNVSMAGDENDGNLGSRLVQFLLDFQATHSRQSDIEHEATGTVWQCVPQKFPGCRERLRMQTNRLQQTLHGGTHAVIIIDNEHCSGVGRCHGMYGHFTAQFKHWRAMDQNADLT